tara:strand:- start:329 stop:754 length:426 start_codon:yes stop_codon:yes gene_type:complete
MKKVLFIAMIVMGVSLQAQPGPGPDGKQRKERLESLTPQQRAELKTKKMTLHLDLTEAQQKKVEALLVSQEKEREAMKSQWQGKKELSDEEAYALKTERLDKQIAMKKEMQQILTEEQFAKFEKMQHRRNSKRNEFKKRKG